MVTKQQEDKEKQSSSSETKQEGYISICPNCHCMVHIIKGKCGKCGFAL